MTLGGGVLVYVGMNTAYAHAVQAQWGVGNFIAVGGGIIQVQGGGLAMTTSQSIYAGVGGLTFLGSGSMTWHGVASTQSSTNEINVSTANHQKKGRAA